MAMRSKWTVCVDAPTSPLISSQDIKGLDEVFEVLASVPWLDEDDLQQKELKGMAVVGLLGTLEEVGFNIRGQVHRIWAGGFSSPRYTTTHSFRALQCGTTQIRT